MAKVYFGKINLNINKEIKTATLPDGTEIEVRQYLPVEEKMSLIDRIINRAVTDKGYYSPAIIDLLITMELIFSYTNINFTDKQKEDIFKLYDLFKSSDAFYEIETAIPMSERNYIYENTYRFIEVLYNYKNSAVGIMETINKDYGDTVFAAEQIQDALGNKENLTLLKDVLDKLG